MSKKPITGKLRLEIENGYANVYDEHGITSLNDILLGWTDTSTGAYASPAEEAAFLEELVRRWNAYSEDQDRGEKPGPVVGVATGLDYYRELLNGYKQKVSGLELSSNEAAAVLRIHDYGVAALDQETTDLLNSVIGKLKDKIWP